MFLSSWYDAYVPSTLANFHAFYAAGRQAALDGAIAPDWLACRLDWFSRHLCAETPEQDGRREVSVFIMGGGSGKRDDAGRLQHGGQWHHAQDWPLPGSRREQWYLQADMGLRPQAAAAAAHILQSDPHHPVPTIGGSITSGLPVFAGGAFDQREALGFFGSAGNNLPLAARADVLVFQSEPLTEDLCVAGDVRVRLWIDSDAPDTDFTAKLVDVYPPNEDYPQGYTMNITDGCGGVFIYALFSREKNGAKFCQGARNGAGLWGVKVCGVVQLGAARNCAVCAVLLQIYLHCLRFKCARLIAFKAGFTPAFLWALFREVVGDVDDLAADLDVVIL